MAQIVNKTNSTLVVRHRSKSLLLSEEIIKLRDEVKRLQSEVVELKKSQTNEFGRIALRASGQTYYVIISNIRYCEASGNYTRIYLTDGSNLFVSQTLKSLETFLPNTIMLRCHQSFLVNQAYIKQYARNGLQLKDVDRMIPVSRRMKSFVMAKIGRAGG